MIRRPHEITAFALAVLAIAAQVVIAGAGGRICVRTAPFPASEGCTSHCCEHEPAPAPAPVDLVIDLFCTITTTDDGACCVAPPPQFAVIAADGADDQPVALAAPVAAAMSACIAAGTAAPGATPTMAPRPPHPPPHLPAVRSVVLLT